MKLVSRAVALGAVAALTFAVPTAAHAGSAGNHAQAAAKAKANDKAEQGRKKAQQARSFAFPGAVTAVTGSTITLSRKERGVLVSRTFVLDSGSKIKRDGANGALADVRAGDRAVVVGVRRDGVLVVRKLHVRSATPTTAPTASPSPSASPAIVI